MEASGLTIVLVEVGQQVLSKEIFWGCAVDLKLFID